MNALTSLLLHAARVALSACALAQSSSSQGIHAPQRDLYFDAAIVKPVNGRSLCKLDITPGRLIAPAASLHCLITKAFDVTDYQLSGVSGWMDTDVYSIMASAGRAVNRAEMMAMLQNLLAERFHLKAHTELRKIQVLALLIGKGGPKVQPLAVGESDVPPANLSSPQRLTLPWGPEISDLIRWLNFYSAGNLGGRLVVDRTGLTGKYKIWVSFDNEMNPDGGGKLDIDLPSAVKQLGLVLMPEQADIPIVVVEKAARPEPE